MKIYPAVDIKDGTCVNLKQGKFDEVTVYFDDPVAAAINWKNCGASYIHIVDLDGARYGTAYSTMIVSAMAKAVNIPVQIGGGIRTMEDIETNINRGVDRVILGTAAITDPGFVKAAVDKYGDKIVVGIDAADGIVKTEGWLTDSGVKTGDLCAQMAEIGVKTVVFTDILKDGMMSGVNIPEMERLINDYGDKIDFIASGGVSSMADLEKLEEIGAKGVIIGKAIYNGALDLCEVIKRFEK